MKNCEYSNFLGSGQSFARITSIRTKISGYEYSNRFYIRTKYMGWINLSAHIRISGGYPDNPTVIRVIRGMFRDSGYTDES